MSRLLRSVLSVAAGCSALLAQMPAAPGHGEFGVQADGSYVNPILPTDVSDLDAIRVGPDFYAITSTFQYSPGMAVLASKDLLHWRIVSHVVPDVTRLSPALNWDRMDRAGRGIWAGSIRYHAGRFWVYFGTPDEGLFMAAAPSVTGPWTPVANVIPEAGWDDPCPFWDSVGQLYLITTRFKAEPAGAYIGKSYTIHLFKLSADGLHVIAGSDRIIHQSRGSEANKLYKVKGTYFHFFSEVAGEGRVVMMARSKSLAGPWETKQLIHVHGAVDKEPNQGGLIELQDGRWYFLTHQGRGDWEGRAGALLPVTWVDNWPILGTVGEDKIGNMTWRGPSPFASKDAVAVESLAVSDDFTHAALDPAWEWNYQPRLGSWSLQARPGFLRLMAAPLLHPGVVESASNLLTQRTERAAFNQVTIKLDVSGTVAGEESGLVHYARTASSLGVSRQGGTQTLAVVTNGVREAGPVVTQTTLWFRSTWGFDGVSQWAYSLDGETYKDIGQPYQLTWGHYRGDRIGVFTYNGAATAGYLDVDSFDYILHKP